VATHVATAAVGVGVPTARAGVASAAAAVASAHDAVASADVGSTTAHDGVASAAVGSPTDRDGVTSDGVGIPTDVMWLLGTAAGKPTFAAAADGIPDVALSQDQSTISNAVATAVAATDLHQSTAIEITALRAVAAGRTAICAFPINDNGWGDLVPLGPRTLRYAAANVATEEAGRRVNQCGL
jgi:hypothetical protein